MIDEDNCVLDEEELKLIESTFKHYSCFSGNRPDNFLEIYKDKKT